MDAGFSEAVDECGQFVDFPLAEYQHAAAKLLQGINALEDLRNGQISGLIVRCRSATKTKKADGALALRKILLGKRGESGLKHPSIQAFGEVVGSGGDHDGFFVEKIGARNEVSIKGKDNCFGVLVGDEGSVDGTRIAVVEGRALERDGIDLDAAERKIGGDLRQEFHCAGKIVRGSI